MKPLLYVICWLFSSRAEWDRIKGSLAQRVDPHAFKPQSFMPASHEEWKAYVRAEEL